MKQAGFGEAELDSETGFNSSPNTKGILARAVRVAEARSEVSEIMTENALQKYREFFDIAYGDGVLDRKTKHLIALGASLGAGCEP